MDLFKNENEEMNEVNAEQAEPTTQELLEKVRETVEKANVCFLTTLSGKQLVSRPMYLLNDGFDGDIWFFSKRDSEKLEEIKKDSRVSVSFSGKAFVSLSGRAEIIDNDLKKQNHWNKNLEQFFGCDYADPSLVLIRVAAEAAHYWENTGTLGGLIKKVQKMDESVAETIDL